MEFKWKPFTRGVERRGRRSVVVVPLTLPVPPTLFARKVTTTTVARYGNGDNQIRISNLSKIRTQMRINYSWPPPRVWGPLLRYPLLTKGTNKWLRSCERCLRGVNWAYELVSNYPRSRVDSCIFTVHKLAKVLDVPKHVFKFLGSGCFPP